MLVPNTAVHIAGEYILNKLLKKWPPLVNPICEGSFDTFKQQQNEKRVNMDNWRMILLVVMNIVAIFNLWWFWRSINFGVYFCSIWRLINLGPVPIAGEYFLNKLLKKWPPLVNPIFEGSFDTFKQQQQQKCVNMDKGYWTEINIGKKYLNWQKNI